MAFDINNFVIDHVIRGVMEDGNGEYLWSVNQITDPSLNVTTEEAEATDALGTPIATFNRGKQADFSANNSLFDLGLFAAQNGVEKQVASSSDKITAPAFETIDVKSGDTEVTLAHSPVADIAVIHYMNGDGSLGKAYTAGSSTSDTQFVYNKEDHKITLPTNLAAGQIFVMYEYETENAVSVTGDAINFPKSGKFTMEVLGTDTCDTSTLIHAYLVFPNAKLDANVDISFTTEGNHPFTIKCQQKYCDSQKILFKLIIPEED